MTVLGLPLSDMLMLGAGIGFGGRLIAVDAREHRLPNRLTGGLAIALLVIAAGDALVRRDWDRWLPMLATALGMGIAGYLLAVLSPDAFGMGDVKLLAVIGLGLGHLDPQTVVLWLLGLALCSGLWLAVAPRFDKAIDRRIPWRKRHVAFGPPLIVAWWLVYAVLAVAAARAQ